MTTLYELCYDTMPVELWDNLAKKSRTITLYDHVNNMFGTADGVWFMGGDTHFSKEAPTQEQAEETTVVIAPPPGPHKCTCNIVELIQMGCQCKGV